MSKRVCTALLCLCLLLTLLPTTAQASTGHEGWPDIEFDDTYDLSGIRAQNISIDESKNYYFSGSSGTWCVVVRGANTVANLYFYDCSIDRTNKTTFSNEYESPIEILDGATVNIFIAGTCTFQGGWGCAAIHKNLAAGQMNIYVKDGGVLNATGGARAAGIGGNYANTENNSSLRYKGGDAYNIALGGYGTINATGGINAPGFGAGRYGRAGNLTIGAVDLGNTTSTPDKGAGSYYFATPKMDGGATSYSIIDAFYDEYTESEKETITFLVGNLQHMYITINAESGDTRMVVPYQEAAKSLIMDQRWYYIRLSYEDCTEKDSWSKQKLLCSVCGRTLKTDTTPPTIGIKSGEKYTLTADSKLKFPVTDDISGVDFMAYKIGENKPVILKDKDDIYEIPMASGVNYTVTAYDNAGNGAAPISFHVRYVYTINYKVGDVLIKSVDCLEDEAVAAEYIPAIPEKTGYTDTDPYWSVDTTDPNAIIKAANGSAVNVKAVYTPNQYTITLPSGTGYKISPEGATQSAAYGTDFSFSVNLQPGFGKAASFAVKVDGAAISANDDGTYTIANVDKAHTVTVEGVASTDAALSALTLSDGTLSPAFAPEKTAYTADVPNSVTAVTVTPTANHAMASVTVNGKAATERVLLNVGENEILVKVTAEDGLTEKTYTITVTRAPSTDATLSNLVLHDGETAIAVNETFAPTRTAYTAEVDYLVSSLTVIPTTNHAMASVTVNGKAATERVLLNVGENEILVKVTAEDGLTEKTYTIIVTRAPAPIGKPVLNFDTCGGDRLESISGDNLATIDLSNYVPTRAGYSFTGWYVDTALRERVTSIRLMKNTTLYAGWVLGNPFTDVAESDWFYADVLSAYQKGLMNGTDDAAFSPYVATTRGMLVTILYRFENEPSVVANNPFTDVESGKYYTSAVLWAVENKLVSGYGNGKFGPDNAVTREQLAAILFNYAKFKGYDVSVGENTNILSYKDAAEVSDYAIPALQWACGAGVMGGDGGRLLPKDGAQRCQTAAMLLRFLNLVQK